MFDEPLRLFSARVLNPLVVAIGKRVSPNTLTALGLVTGLLCAVAAALGEGYETACISLWVVNRLLDALDGQVARANNLSTVYGGYWDILCDFTVYALVPVGLTVCASHQVLGDAGNDTVTRISVVESHRLWLALALMECSFFVNAAGLFFLSAVYERLGKEHKTTVPMNSVGGRCLIEGGETLLAMSLMVAYREPAFLLTIFRVFALAVTATIIQRLNWARINL